LDSLGGGGPSQSRLAPTLKQAPTQAFHTMQPFADAPDADWRFYLIRRIKRLMFLFCHFPALDANYIKKFIERPSTPADEIGAHYENCSNRGHGTLAIIIAVYLLYFCKNFYIPFETLRLFDHDRPERSVVVVGGGAGTTTNSCAAAGFRPTAPVKQIACLSSDCVRLAPSNVDDRIYYSTTGNASRATLADDFQRLPLFHICHPNIDKIYTPVDKLDSFGLLAFIWSAFNVLLLGVLATLQQLLFPSPNEMVFFLVAPVATRQLALDRAAELASEVAASFRNYCNKHKELVRRGLIGKRFKDERLVPADRWCGLRSALVARPDPVVLGPKVAGAVLTIKGARSATLSTQKRPSCPQEANSPELAELQLTSLGSATNSHRRPSWPTRADALADCLSTIRTRWWRNVLASVYIWMLVVACLIVASLAVFCFAYIQYRVVKKRQLLAAMGAEMSRSNCSIWLTDSLAGGLAGSIDGACNATGGRAAANKAQRPPQLAAAAIDVANLNLEWSWFAMLETASLNVVPAVFVGIMVAYNWTLVTELSVWLAEVRLYLVATSVVVGLKLAGPGNGLYGGSAGRTPPVRHESTTRHIYNMDYLKRKFQLETQSFSIFSFCSIQRPDDKRPIGDPENGSHSRHQLCCNNSRLVDRIREYQLTKLLLGTSDADYHRNGRTACTERELADDLEHAIETMEKVYVNFRMFIEHVRKATPGNATVFSIMYLLNYGLAIIGVVSSMRLHNLRSEPTFFIILGLTLANLQIFVGANFHAEAKKLQPIIWSIIAKMVHSSDLRVMHMRALWLKQAWSLNEQGGLALSALWMRITYINILQLALWTTTIIIIVIR
jgi:hypothetical protein